MQQKRRSTPSIAYVLQKISDDKTLILLRNIALSVGRNHIPDCKTILLEDFGLDGCWPNYKESRKVFSFLLRKGSV
jgi:hypothetical protein